MVVVVNAFYLYMVYTLAAVVFVNAFIFSYFFLLLFFYIYLLPSFSFYAHSFLQLEHLLESLPTAQRLQLQMRTEIRAETPDCPAGQRSKSLHGLILVSELLRLYDSGELSAPRLSSAGRKNAVEVNALRLKILTNHCLINLWRL